MAVWFWVAPQPVGSDVNIRSELSALARPQVWMALLVGMVGFGGMFATYSYITPTMTELAGFSESAVTVVLAAYGVGMTCGTVVGGRLADRALMPSLYGGLIAVAVVLGTFGWLAQTRPGALIGVFAMGFSASILVPALQTRLMDVAHGGQSLAASLNHSTLNIANALGAWLGSVVLAAGFGYEWPSRFGAVLAVAGLALALVSGLMDRRTVRNSGARPGRRLRACSPRTWLDRCMATMTLSAADQVRRRGLRQMRSVALGLLLLAVAIYVATLHLEGGWGYVNTAAEAAMVGALADWFAVTALFRHPLGLPIPHTAIVPTRKDSLAESLEQFVTENFLSEEVVAEKMRTAEVSRRAGEWLAAGNHAERIVAEGARTIGAALPRLGDEDVTAFVRGRCCRGSCRSR